MASPKAELHRLLEEHGFKLERQTNHQVWKNPEGKTFVCAQTPSDKWADANALANLRRLVGWKPEPRKPKAKREYRKRRAAPSPAPSPSATNSRPTMAEQLRAIYREKQ